jgi:general secretion pathway protein G
MTQLCAKQSNGFGLLELVVTLAIGSLLIVVAVPSYIGFADRAKIATAISDIRGLSLAIDQFSRNNDEQIPATLADLPTEIPLDPWGNEYQYLNIPAAGPANDQFRKYGNLSPLNSDFDLFSAGEDGDTAGPLSAKQSRDDIVRASNGAFVGLGEDY